MDAKLLNDNGIMNQTLTVEQRVLIGSLHTVYAIHNLFTRHQLNWIARCGGRYIEELVQEFYASYVETLKASLDRKSNPA